MDVAVVRPNGKIVNMIVVGSVDEAVPDDGLAVVSVAGDWRAMSYGANSGVFPTPLSPVVRTSSVRIDRNLYTGLNLCR